MNSIDRLVEIFSKFPGIGPRQARRFVYHILYKDEGHSHELTRAIEEVRREIHQCELCRRYFAKSGSISKSCPICIDTTRDQTMLMIVPKDVDLDAIEKSGSYHGYYFVLGGAIPILDKEPEKRIRIKSLESRIEKCLKSGLKEIILAMNANAEGENTAQFIKELYRDSNLTFSVLGRGLSTGTELEYADPETLKNALLHRTK